MLADLSLDIPHSIAVTLNSLPSSSQPCTFICSLPLSNRRHSIESRILTKATLVIQKGMPRWDMQQLVGCGSWLELIVGRQNRHPLFGATLSINLASTCHLLLALVDMVTVTYKLEGSLERCWCTSPQKLVCDNCNMRRGYDKDCYKKVFSNETLMVHCTAKTAKTVQGCCNLVRVRSENWCH